jgi:CheY-like chemotaxis protein/HPt (histidine-containing phosphotransfer) domain-containing protein
MKKIAVVEDNPDNRLLVRVILESLYEVVEYETGFAALEGFLKQKPDAVLLDISLPEMDGGEVLRRIRAEGALADLPVIALTAHAMAGDREKYLGAGFNDYVTKPIVDETILLEAIQRQLSRAPATPSSASPESSPMQVAAIERLRKLGGDEFVNKMIDLFLDYTGTKIADARKAGTAGDLAALAKAVHPIKSSAGNIGASRVQELAARLEQLGKQPTGGEELSRLLDELEIAFAEAQQVLEAEKSKAEPKSI